MAETCRETCPIVAMVHGLEQLLQIISEDGPRKYLSQLDRLQAATDGSMHQLDPEFAAQIGDSEHLIRDHGPKVVEITELAEDLRFTPDDIITAAIELCPGFKIEPGAGVGSCVIECGGFSVKAIKGLTESQIILTKTIDLMRK